MHVGGRRRRREHRGDPGRAEILLLAGATDILNFGEPGSGRSLNLSTFAARLAGASGTPDHRREGGSAKPTCGFAMIYPTKAPSDLLDYRLDLTDWLTQSSNDAVQAISLTTAPPGLVVVHPPTPGPHPTVWLSGGASQTEYVLTWTATTAAGRAQTTIASLVVD